MPRVSVIVPFFNAAPYLECCIRSVLSQTMNDWELLLINDGSTDRSLDIAQEFANHDTRIRVLQHANGENLGVSRSRQLGLDHAAGEFIAFLDADDLFHQNKLENQIRDAESRPRCGVFHTAVKTINEDGLPVHGKNSFNDFSAFSREYAFGDERKFLQSHAVCNSSTMIRRYCLDGLTIGYSQLFQIEDFVLWVRLSERTRFYFSVEPMVSYREHSENATHKTGRNPAACDLRNVEFLSAVIATCQNDTIISLARELQRQALFEMERRISVETCLCKIEKPIEQKSTPGVFRTRMFGLIRRIRRAIQVLCFGGYSN